jgi:hypothetical protein
MSRRPGRVAAERERISRRLSSFVLVDEPEGDARVRFADYYSEAGLRRVFAAYGVDAALAARGLGDWRMRVERDDPFHHRLVLFVEDPDDAAKRIADLRIHLCRTALPGDVDGAQWDVVAIEWLSMQNPRASFSAEKPRLPGQQRPGTGMGRLVHDLLVLMTRRLGRDALLNVPERPHLVELYLLAGWRFVDAAGAVPIRAALDAASALPFAHRAWAIERGFVVHEDGAPFVYRPLEMLLPVSERLEGAIDAGDGMLARLMRYVTGPDAPRLRLDEAGFARSLVEDPVEGLAPTW